MALLDRELVFSQRRLLVSRDFERAARDRGVLLAFDDLDRLHASGVLPPLYVSRRPMVGVRKAVRSTPSDHYPDLPHWIFNPDIAGLRSDRDQGYLTIGTTSEHGGRLDRMIGGFRIQMRERLYSPYQLLDLARVKDVLQAIRSAPRRRDAWMRARLQHATTGTEARRDLSIALSALEVHYYPRLIHRVTGQFPDGIEAWDRVNRAFDPIEVLAWLGWTPDEILAAAEDLILQAHQRDPIDAWSDLVGLVAPARWQQLRGDALLALELRLAGEMLLRLHEDLQARRAAPAFPPIPKRALHELNWRIRTDPSRLDEVLTSFGLSPHPAIVLVVEGQTEMAIAPLVMEELGIPRRDAYIRIVNAHTETKDHSLLVSYAAIPKLGPVKRGHAAFLRPPTRYFIVVDGDRKFRTQAARDRQRESWVARIVDGLPPEVSTPTGLAEIDALVVLEAWHDGLDFERAHFTDEELAGAILTTGLVPTGITRDDLVRSLTQQRAAALSGHTASLEDVWKRWPRKPSKPDLALAMWPILRTRIRRTRSRRGLDRIPFARVLMRAHELAARTPRRDVVFRVGDDADGQTP